MKAYLVKTPWIVRAFFSKYIWKKNSTEKEIYLTFDDGPIPVITPWVLQTLKKYQAKATFFSIGDNIKKYPEIFAQVVKENHRIGNHTFNHLRGSKTDNQIYFKNTQKTEDILKLALKKIIILTRKGH